MLKVKATEEEMFPEEDLESPTLVLGSRSAVCL